VVDWWIFTLPDLGSREGTDTKLSPFPSGDRRYESRLSVSNGSFFSPHIFTVFFAFWAARL